MFLVPTIGTPLGRRPENHVVVSSGVNERVGEGKSPPTLSVFLLNGKIEFQNLYIEKDNGYKLKLLRTP